MAIDPDYSSVSLLLHCDGSNGSTTFTDNSPSPKTVTANGNAQISTAQSKFGGASGLFDGTGDYLSVPSNADFDLTGDYTLEFFIRPESLAGNFGILHRGFYNSSTNTWTGGLSFSIRHIGSGTVRFYFYGTTNANEQYLDVTSCLTANTWTHIAVVHSGTTGKVFVNGVLAGTKTSLNTVSTSSESLRIGVWDYSAGSEYFNGYLDDIRITKGVARYSADFTPPTEAFYHPEPLIPTQGTLTVTGLMPSLALGFADSPTQGTLTLTGQTPKHSSITFLGTPVQGSMDATGLQPSLAMGFAALPIQGALAVSGQQPALGIGFADTPGQGALTISGLVPKHSSNTFLGTPGQGILAITGLQPVAAFGFAAAPTIRQLTVTGLTPDFANRIIHPIANHWISTHYLCVLTGSADSLPDLTLPISSFQTRMGADPFRVYLSVILPNADAYIADINARPNGRIKVTRVYNYLDGSFQSFNMAEAPIDSISTNQGGKSGTTGTLTGYETLIAATAQSVTLYDPITRSSSAGGRRYRCRIDPRLRPLDTAVINGESFVVDGVIHIIDTQTAIMEISEKL